MECNKDEAKRAMDVAEMKIREKDYNGAKRFANKAQNLFPELDGLKQLLTAIDVYISAEKKIYGEADWYGILGVDPTANDEAMKRQYRKLILMLHPDKNKCNGAEGAFNLVADAWNLLSDKTKRLLYDEKRSKDVRQSFPTTQSGNIPPHHPTSSWSTTQVVYKPVILNARARSNPAVRMDRSSVGSVFSMPEQISNTFWSKCWKCITLYQYPRVYLNQHLLCPTCRQGFIALEVPPPVTVPKPPANRSSNQQRKSSKKQASRKTSSRREPAAPSVNHNFRWNSSSRTAGSNSRDVTNQAENVVQQAQVKRERVKSQEKDTAIKRRKIDDSNMRGDQTSARHVDNGNTETPNTLGSRLPHVQEMLLPNDVVTKVLMDRGQSEIFKRLPKMITEMEAKLRVAECEKKSMEATIKESGKTNEVVRSVEEVKTNEVERSVEEVKKNVVERLVEEVKKNVVERLVEEVKKNVVGRSVEEVKKNEVERSVEEVKTIIVPDSDFQNFDFDRSESSIKEDQIWAAYDNDDGMPRFYACVEKVISLEPFKMEISWLNSKSTSEFGHMDWIRSGFVKTCGEFRSGRYESTDTVSPFSHKVVFTKDARGLHHILPTKGQVWALYRNWSLEWDKNTPKEVKHKYELVQVLDDYTKDKQSVSVALLLKAEGFKAVFRRSIDGNDMREIPKEEMFRFSHQVPHYILTGKEADNAPQGCLELDPAATPLEFFSEEADGNERSEAVKVKSSIPEEKVGMDLDEWFEL